jgi:ammonium transporter, Amt family
MIFFTFPRARNLGWVVLAFLELLSLAGTQLHAQPETNTAVPGPGEISASNNTNAPATNSVTSVFSIPAASETSATTAPPPAPAAIAPAAPAPDVSGFVLAALITLVSLGGFLLYQCGLGRAKNSGHTSMLLLVGVVFGLVGYWVGGFAVQTGGIGDAHAALAQTLPPTERSALDHEFGPMILGHHWGLMGSAGFFLATEDPARNGIATLFLIQAALLTITLAAALGAALERGRILALAFCAFLIGWLIYPLLANWVWGGGWLAELGREFGLGHGFIDLAGAGVVHETAGVLALVIAIVLGPRHGRFGRGTPANTMQGHNVPFIVLGSVILLVSWLAANALACTNLPTDGSTPDPVSGAGTAAVNTLLAAAAGLVVSYIQAAWQKRRPEPARLCRGLLGGAVASCGGAGLIDPWAAFVIGGVAGGLVQWTVDCLERKRIDDPVGAVAVHGAGGAWGVLAVGFFANGTAGYGLNGVTAPIRGLFFGGAWHQLAAQALGCVTAFVVVYILGYACVTLVQKILGLRVSLTAEAEGLDWSEVGALGYQGDAEPVDEDDPGKS